VPAVADGSRAILADSWTANTAQIVAAQPDLVIASVPSLVRGMGQASHRVANRVAELVEAAGGDFMSTPGRQTAAEEIRRLNPEVIVTAWCGAGERVPLEKIIAQRGWQNTAAALSRHIFCIRDELLNTLPLPH
jgi:ABC-type Fe3+-hydroxamate transport system substrate-binding protein